MLLPWTEKTPEDIMTAWTRTTEKLYELLQWAHSEGLTDLKTMNSYIETMADQTDLFKTVKSDFEQQKQVGMFAGLLKLVVLYEGNYCGGWKLSLRSQLHDSNKWIWGRFYEVFYK
jgi:hypothetical protein